MQFNLSFNNEIKCQERPIARMQDFAPFIPELLGAFSSPRPLAVKGTDDTAKVGVKHQSINYLPPKNQTINVV
jgi:hypothetical protein